MTASDPPLPPPPTRPPRSRARRRRTPGGRPHYVTVRLSEEEFETVSARAADAGLSAGAFLAGAADSRTGLGVSGMSAAERRGWATELMAVRRLLAATGNNINQLARASNSGVAVNAGVTAAAIRADDRARARLAEILDQLHGGRS